MATYAIGDVQGCFASLQSLLDRIGYSPATDRLLFLGDLVGRGADALSVLRFISREPAAEVVLGNHDLFLIACARHLVRPAASDRLDDALLAPDGPALVAWLRQQPFARMAAGFLCVHAGVLPSWTCEQVLSVSERTSKQLQGAHGDAMLRGLFGVPSDVAADAASASPVAAPAAARSDARANDAELAEALEVLTCVRALDPAARLVREAKGTLAELPPGALPWFRVPGRNTASTPIAFGHWAALGCHHEGNVWALDGGCVWGRDLCALRLEDRQIIRVANAERPTTDGTTPR